MKEKIRKISIDMHPVIRDDRAQIEYLATIWRGEFCRGTDARTYKISPYSAAVHALGTLEDTGAVKTTSDLFVFPQVTYTRKGDRP